MKNLNDKKKKQIANISMLIILPIPIVPYRTVCMSRRLCVG